MTSFSSDTKKEAAPWEIWYANVRFEDNPSKAKERPVLIIDKSDDGFAAAVYISMKITSHPPRKNYPGEYAIRNWKASGLDKPSTIRTMHIFRLHESELRYKIGRLSVIDIAAVKNILRQ